jgi:hypothetical protein
MSVGLYKYPIKLHTIALDLRENVIICRVAEILSRDKIRFFSCQRQGCQMVYFRTKKADFG